MTIFLAHRVDGEGDPLLLLNGGMMSIAAWDPIAVPLAAGYRVIRCDLRGQLLSPFPAPDSARADYAFEDHAREVIALLDHLGIEKTHVVGTSFGGEVAMLLASGFPDRVASLVVITATDRLTPKMRAASRSLKALAVAAANGGDGGELFTRLAPSAFSERWLDSQPADFVQTRARLFAKLPAIYFEGVASLMQALIGLDLDERLPKITAPTLIVGAGLDRTFPPEHSRAIAAAIPDARLEMMEECGHAAVAESPARVVELLLAFLGSIERKEN